MPVLKGKPTRPSGIRKADSDTSAIVAVVLVVVSLVVFTMSARETETGPFTTARGVFQTITTPVRIAGAAISVPFQGLANVFSNLTADQATLSELREQNEALTKKNAELEEAEQTAARLQDLLALQSTYGLKSKAARVISGSSDSWSDTITIDKGTAAGINIGMSVTDSSGSIGQVVESSATSSVVRLITDENSAVSAMVQSSRAHGVLRGSADGTLHLTMVGTDQSVNVGDTIVTSGLGGVFPKGLPLGKVISVNKTDGALYYDIVVNRLFNIENLEEVLVITSLTEGQKATSDDIAEADAQETSAIVSPSESEQGQSTDTANSGSEGSAQEGSAQDTQTDSNSGGTAEGGTKRAN